VRHINVRSEAVITLGKINIFSIHCFFAKQKSKRMVRNGEEVRGGVARLEDVRCHGSGVTKEIICETPHAIGY
jgi:hypothetical protein